ncbi:hypothetical protein QJS04_geneDACA013355 [Acorus gramineus]|uniref:Transmembrane protein n=1 Tax=Acorus gramineus TaxID=55184 RepID=A0AAV9A902_ACOGR|nr:hypothetical protein QJS04_geneDACA013355 [Acorus gramineus]
MDHLMRRTQGETTITSQDNLNRAPEAGNTNRAADQQEDSWQSENDKQVVDSGWEISKWVSIAVVVIVIGLLAHALLLELIYTVMVIILAVITVILGPVTLICIGRWKEDSQQSATDKEAIECGWKSCLMNIFASSTLIVGVFHMQHGPT